MSTLRLWNSLTLGQIQLHKEGKMLWSTSHSTNNGMRTAKSKHRLLLRKSVAADFMVLFHWSWNQSWSQRPKPSDISSTRWDPAKEGTEEGAARGQRLHLLSPWWPQTVLTCKAGCRFWEAPERSSPDRLDIHEYQLLAHPSVSNQSSSVTLRFLILMSPGLPALLGRAFWAHRLPGTFSNSIPLAWKENKQFDANFKVALVWHFSSACWNPRAPSKSPVWVRDQSLANLGFKDLRTKTN